MEYNSFYGGRRGASFVIVKKYNSIAEMISSFSQGGGYTAVNYDEYVLIDTENKNDQDNGKVYRRGYEYNDELGGAIYIGQIVGPSGMAPAVEMSTIEEVEEQVEREGFEYRKSSGEYNIENSLVPGKYTENSTIKYNDEIKWACCSVRDENNTDTIAYVGFSFPYTVIDYVGESVSAYYNQPLAERLDNGAHPFYEKWKISIPKGIKGDAFKNLRVVTANNSIEDYIGKQDDIDNNRKVLVYDSYDYTSNEQGIVKTYYLGDYNLISNVEVDNAGTLTISYTHDDDTVLTNKIKWISNIQIMTGDTEGTGSQKVKVTYNDGTFAEIGQPLNYIIETAIDDRYHLLVYYSDPVKRNSFSPKATYHGKNDWSDLGYIGNGTGVGAIIGEEDDPNISAVAANMPPYSAWLIVE